jgi:hypothetical protein
MRIKVVLALLLLRFKTTIIALGAVGILVSVPTYALAQSTWDFPELKQATDAYQRGDCQRAWEIIWPLAKAGNHEAQYFLWASLIGKMMPPGHHSGLPRSSRARHELTLAAYAALARRGPNPLNGDPDHRWVQKEIPRLIDELGFGSKGKQVAQCYQSATSFRDCLHLAVSLGVVPAFEDYSKEIDTMARDTARGAYCSYPH